MFSAFEDEATSDYKRHFVNLDFLFLMDILRNFLTWKGLIIKRYYIKSKVSQKRRLFITTLLSACLHVQQPFYSQPPFPLGRVGCFPSKRDNSNFSVAKILIKA